MRWVNCKAKPPQKTEIYEVVFLQFPALQFTGLLELGATVLVIAANACQKGATKERQEQRVSWLAPPGDDSARHGCD